MQDEDQIRILVHVNTFAPVNSFVYSNHVEMFTHTTRQEPNIRLILFTPHRSSIDRMRTEAALMAIKLDCKFLLFIDDDVLVPRDVIMRLIKAEKDIMAGLVVIRGVPFNLMAFQDCTPEEAAAGKSGFMNDIVDKAKATNEPIQAVDGVGFSCCMINVDLIKAMEPPYFITGPTHTEDTFFCKKAQTIFGKDQVSIAVDTRIRCGHMMTPEPIEYDTIPLFAAFYDGLRKLQGYAPGSVEWTRSYQFLSHTLKGLANED